jgi:protein dithiol oxidoreductase (disulfide-forming)
MKRFLIAIFALAAAAATQAQPVRYLAGKHYVEIPPQRTSVPAGKVEVMEVFSYGCPACNQFRPMMKQIQAALPKNAQLVYLPASWNPGENWPTFQRAYLTALALGVSEKAHEAMYDAIWSSGELAVVDQSTGRLKRNLPTIADIAKLYQRVAGVKPEDFVKASKSYTVDMKVAQADKQIQAMGVLSTPTLVVAGKYRIVTDQLRNLDDIIGVINYLVAKETPAATAPAKPAAAAPAPAAKKP